MASTSTFPTMTDMELDSIQQTTQATLTTSLAKKGSQKSSFLDIFPFETNPTSSVNDSTPVMTPPLKSGFFDDKIHEEYIPLNSPSPLPAPRPNPTAPYPSAASIAGAMARLKNLLNQLPVQTNQILPRYFFQSYVNLIITKKQVFTTLYGLQLKAQK